MIPYCMTRENAAGNCYWILEEALDWESAQAKCQARQGHLATVTSPEEETFIYQNLYLENK